MQNDNKESGGAAVVAEQAAVTKAPVKKTAAKKAVVKKAMAKKVLSLALFCRDCKG